MTVADWVQIVTVPAVAAALILNAFQLREVARQTKAVGASLEQDAFHTLLVSRADLAGMFLGNDADVLRWHLGTRGYDVPSRDDAHRALFALLRLNAHQSSYLSYAAGRVGADLWTGWKNGLVADLSVPEYQALWPVARRFYATSFVAFVDSLLHDLEPNGADAT
jgi:hypothetical protein